MARRGILNKIQSFPKLGPLGGGTGDRPRAIFRDKRRDTRKRLYKTDIVRLVAKDTRLSQRVIGDAVNGVIKQITSALAKDESVLFPGFGTFYTRTRPASSARSFDTGKTIRIPAMPVAAFRPGETLKHAVRKTTKAK